MDSAAEMLTAGTPTGRHLPGRRQCAACPKMAAVRLMRAGPDGQLYGSGCHRRLFPSEYNNRTPSSPRTAAAATRREAPGPQLPTLFDQPKEQPAMTQLDNHRHVPGKGFIHVDDLTTARRFVVERSSDPTEASGTGVVLDGILWPDGTASVRWRGDDPSFVSWPSIKAAERKHCYGGHSRIVWVDPAPADGMPA